MTGLLVSVRSAAEAELAVAAGADLIDVKEPNRGSLGAADPAVWREVAEAVNDRVPVSVALGELCERAADSARHTGRGIQLAKCGLAGVARLPQWMAHWRKLLSQLPSGVRPVAVAYADWQAAEAPPPEEVLAAASLAGAPYLLVDTYDKSAGNLLAHLSPEVLVDLSARAADRQIRLVLAGSLDAAAIATLLLLRPAYFAVRGAVCRGDRTQAIDAARVKRLAALVRTSVCTSSISLLDT